MNIFLQVYTLLALVSGSLAYVWQSIPLPSTTPQSFLIHSYQHTLGAMDGHSCPSYPVCSVYARQAFQQHGWLLASWLSLDRLIHENDDVHGNHIIDVDGDIRFDDSLQRNDAWLKKGMYSQQ